jgi:hypothetical protein
VKALHRAYRGSMVYLTNGIGETGREHFSVTIQPDGARTLRAQCEMDDDALLRDVMLTVDAARRPIDAFLRLCIGGETLGSTWFRFDSSGAEAEGWLNERGRFRQNVPFDFRPAFFGTHSLHGDAWVAGRLRAHDGALEDFVFSPLASSVLANGGSGPELIVTPPGFARVRDMGWEPVSVPAGRFDCHHVRIEVDGVDHFDVWAAGEDCLPVRLTSDGLGQAYEMVSIQGDWR